MPSDSTLLGIDGHPNIEVRMFNPVALRSLRLLGMVTDFRRINRRMHNKSFIADGRIAIVGGRNIGDESELAKRIPEVIERVLGHIAYRVQLDHNRLIWVTREGDREICYTSEPEAGFGKRVKAMVLGGLPIEGLL